MGQLCIVLLIDPTSVMYAAKIDQIGIGSFEEPGKTIMALPNSDIIVLVQSEIEECIHRNKLQ